MKLKFKHLYCNSQPIFTAESMIRAAERARSRMFDGFNNEVING